MVCRILEEERPDPAARLLAALDEVGGRNDPADTLGGIQEFLAEIGKFTSPRIARAKW